MSTLVATMVVLAHQSDWLAMVLVLIPLGCFCWILAIANRRATRDGPVELGPPDAAEPRESDATWR